MPPRLPVFSPTPVIWITMGGKMPTSAMGSAMDLPPAMPMAIFPIAFSTTMLPAVDATTRSASITDTPAFNRVPSVREKLAVDDFICKSPILGTFSMNLSQANFTFGTFMDILKPMIAPITARKRNAPLSRMKSDMLITTCVGAGSSASSAANCSANVGTTKVMRAITTKIPTMITITG